MIDSTQSVAIRAGEANQETDQGNRVQLNRFSSHPKIVAWVLLLAFFMPQLILLLLNLNAWGLIGHQASDQNLEHAIWLVSAQLLVLMINACVAIWVLRCGFEAVIRVALLLLFAHVCLLFCVLFWADNVVPDTIPMWMFNTDNHIYLNVALVMPAAFLSVYVLVKQLVDSYSTSNFVLASVASVFGVPFVWYLFFVLLQPVSLGQFGIVLTFAVAAFTLLMFVAGILALLDTLFTQRILASETKQQLFFSLIIGLVAPLAGLLLNREIPFPNNFQSVWVYAFTVFNALILVVPLRDNSWASFRLYCRGMTLPFAAYFFLVFLPFLPLSIFAILAMGVGFLMLSPLALGMFQTRTTWFEFKLVARRSGRYRALALLMVGLLTLPALFVIKANLDRVALNKVLNYFYASEYVQEPLSDTEIQRSTQAILTLRDTKKGLQLPYIAWVYNHIVYGRMVLSDAKIEQLYQWLSDEKLPSFQHNSLFAGWGGSSWGPRLVAPQTDVKIEHAELIQLTSSSSKVRLSLRNISNNTHSLYRTQFQLPEGVFISGLKLKIDGEWVAAKVHDKKTALWVFRKITEVRRDPALVYYENANTLSLQVYPFPAKGLREVELTFSYHPSIVVETSFDGTRIVINEPQHRLVEHPAVTTVGNVALIDGPALSGNAYQRQAYMHVVLPFTRSYQRTTEQTVSDIQRVARELSLDKVHISAANLNVSANPIRLLEIDDAASLREQINDLGLAQKAGFWLDNALSKLIRKHQSSKIALSHKPIFVVLADQPEQRPEPVEVSDWQVNLPDIGYWVWAQGDTIEKYAVLPSVAQNIVGVRVDEVNHVITPTTTRLIRFDRENRIRVFDQHQTKFVPLEPLSSQFNGAPNNERGTATDQWLRNANAWLDWRDASASTAQLNRQRSDLLSSAKKLGLILPTTAAIVVENNAQWEVLQRKEKQSLNNHAALDFEDQQDTPEPAEWLMILALITFLMYKNGGLLRRFLSFSGCNTRRVV